jgi:T5orf172 domain
LQLYAAIVQTWFSPGGTYCGGVIYAAREDGTPLIKIGYSTDLPRRLKELPREYHAAVTLLAAVPVVCCGLRVERWIHQALAGARLESEWFYCHMDVPTLTTLVQQAMVALHGSQRAYHRRPLRGAD